MPPVAVLTLATRPDRMKAFYERWNGPPPMEYISTTSHRESMRALWSTLVTDTLVLEDDVVLHPRWQEALQRAEVPDDWDLLYLGGQHQRRPKREAGDVVRCIATCRTHAMIVRHSAVPRLLELTEEPQSQHLDMDLATLMQQGEITAYAVWPWIAGQAAGRSDISGRDEPERWWHSDASRDLPRYWV